MLFRSKPQKVPLQFPTLSAAENWIHTPEGKDMIADMAEMLEQAGAKMVTTFDAGSFPGMAIHEMGTARMGRDPKTSVLNSHNQVWDAPNVFVTDGACMVSSACQNPSLTYMALTARAVDFAVNELNRRNL